MNTKVGGVPDKAMESVLSMELKAGELRRKLINGEKRIVLTYKPGEKPDVKFTGFWNGKFLKAAMGSISRAYRLRRYEKVHDVPKKRVEARKQEESNEKAK